MPLQAYIHTPDKCRIPFPVQTSANSKPNIPYNSAVGLVFIYSIFVPNICFEVKEVAELFLTTLSPHLPHPPAQKSDVLSFGKQFAHGMPMSSFYECYNLRNNNYSSLCHIKHYSTSRTKLTELIIVKSTFRNNS